MTAQRLAAWEALCNWFAGQPYHAAYDPQFKGCPHTYLLCRLPSGAYPRDEAERAAARQIVAERRRIKVIYWRTGKGWQLRKDWKEKLEALRAETAAQAERQQQMMLRSLLEAH